MVVTGEEQVNAVLFQEGEDETSQVCHLSFGGCPIFAQGAVRSRRKDRGMDNDDLPSCLCFSEILCEPFVLLGIRIKCGKIAVQMDKVDGASVVAEPSFVIW